MPARPTANSARPWRPKLGVCSWSLRPATPEELAASVAGLPIDAVQLDLTPLIGGAWDEDRTFRLLEESGIEITSGMLAFEHEDYGSLDSIRRTGGLTPDEHWPRCEAELQAAATIAERRGLGLVTTHAGHLPEAIGRTEVDSVMVDRLHTAAAIFAERGVRLGLETGQESAGTLEAYLDAVPDAAVNFDPANMILYGMGDPHNALERLAPRVVQIHIKDAVPAPEPGIWGAEVVVGTGAVDWSRLLETAARACPRAPLMIEREAGEERAEDIAAGASLVTEAIEGASR
ncbi:MAG: TIM barrel protein [Planctomycetota bacterium]